MKPSKRNHRQIFEVKTSAGYKIIDSNNLVFLEAKGKFTIIHFEDHSQIITYHMLKWYTEYLFEPFFFRCHRSYSINCSYVNYYTSKEIIMIDGTIVPLSRDKISSLKEKLRCFLEIQANSSLR